MGLKLPMTLMMINQVKPNKVQFKLEVNAMVSKSSTITSVQN